MLKKEITSAVSSRALRWRVESSRGEVICEGDKNVFPAAGGGIGEDSICLGVPVVAVQETGEREGKYNIFRNWCEEILAEGPRERATQSRSNKVGRKRGTGATE